MNVQNRHTLSITNNNKCYLVLLESVLSKNIPNTRINFTAISDSIIQLKFGFQQIMN